MRLPAPLRSARTLAAGTIVQRGALLGVLALTERLLTPATAWALFARPFGVKLAVSVVLGAVFTVRTFLTRSFAARTEADLMERAIGSVLDGDVLRASVLPSEDARAELGQGVYVSALQLSEVLPAVAADLLAAGGLTIIMLLVEPLRLVLGAVALMVVAALVLMWSRGRLQSAARLAWERHEDLQETMVDALEGRLEIVGSGERAAFAARARTRAHAWGAAGVRMASSSLISGRLPLLAIACAVAILVTVDSRWQGALSVSLADVALFASMAPAFAGIGQGVHSVIQAERWVRAVAQVVEGARPRPGHEPAPPFPAPIAFEGVSFRYEGADADALTGIDLTWNDQRVLALSGANGSGKSTWLRLLLGLGSPRAGQIRVGGVDLAAVDADSWRRHVAFLPQRPYLPPRADVGETVRLLAPAASDARITSALERVGLLVNLRATSPDPLSVRVDTLSVGQRQRIAVARMLCRDASLFVLDEPDANLDYEGITLIAKLVCDLSSHHKVVVAAHTPALLSVADRVIELDRGRIVRDERKHPAPG